MEQMLQRNLYKKAEQLLSYFPVVLILGARQTGKTTLSKQLGKNWTWVDLQNEADFDRISFDPTLFFKQHPQHVVIDEAQEYPDIFKALRVVVDANRDQKGRFIITGSSSPELSKHVSESLAGRVGIIRVDPLKANEVYKKPISRFYEALSKNQLFPELFLELNPQCSLADMEKVWLKGGYPEPVIQQDASFHSLWMTNYFSTYIERDVARLFPKLDSIAFRRFIRTLSKLSGTIVNKADLGRHIEVSEKTIHHYIDIAEGTFIWRNVLSFEKNVVKSIIKMPKGYISDTGLLHFLRHISEPGDLESDPMVGESFEQFVIEEILRGLETLTTKTAYHYYRTRNGAEIDLVLDGVFGVLPIEIKHGSYTPMSKLKSLSGFIEEHNLPLGLVINRSATVQWLTPKILQIPVNYL